MRKPITLFLMLVAAIVASAQNTKEPVKVTDLLKIKAVSGVTLSNDGSKAAFTVTAIEPDGDIKWEYKYVNQIWVAATDGGAPRQLTGKESSSQASFSPDGKQLAFVRLADGKPQIFLISLSGGEAQQLTRYKYGASTPKWSPDGKEILFSSNISLKDLLKDSVLNPTHAIPSWPFEKPGFDKNQQLRSSSAKADPDGNVEEVRTYLENNVTDKKAKVLNNLDLQDETDVSAEARFNHFFMVNAQTGTDPLAITHGFFNFNNADFTPDGKQLVLTGDIDSVQNADRSLESEIFLVNHDGSNLHKLLGEEGKSFTSAKISPSGKWLAFQYSATFSVNVPVLAIIPLNGTASDMVTIPVDRNKGALTWSNDEKYIYFNSPSNGGQPLYRADVKTKQTEQLSDYHSGVVSYDLVNNKTVFVKTEPADPFEVYVADGALKNAKRISNFNYDWLQKKQLSFPEKKTFTNNKGQAIEYWVMKPDNYQAGKKFPLLLNIHGGPAAMWGPGETSMWHEFQFWCSKGYGVVYCNPRGSGGYGLEFLRANMNDWGTGPNQ